MATDKQTRADRACINPMDTAPLTAFSHQVVFPAGLGAEKADLQF